MRQNCSFCLLISDYDKAIDFYCRVLNLFYVDTDTDLGDGHRFVYLNYSDSRFLFSIHLSKAMADESDLIGRQAGRGLLLSFPVDDADAMLAQLKNCNATVEGEIIELPYGRQLIAEDCFGNRISFFERYDFSD